MTIFVKKHPLYWLLRGLSCLPSFILYGFARLVAFLAWHSNSDMRRITELNLGYCFPAMPEDERKVLAKRSLFETACVAVEMPAYFFNDPENDLKKIASVQGGELIDEAIAAGNGVIILAPHIGNWEYLGRYLTKHYDCQFMFKPGKHAFINTLMTSVRSQAGAELIPTNKLGVIKLLKHLKRGGLSGILPDQVPDQVEARVTAPFYGQLAPTMTLVSSFAKKPNIKVIAGVAIRLPNKQFEVVFQPVDDKLYSKDVAVSATALNAAVEGLITLAPAQYQWEYKRFKYDETGAKHKLYQKK